MALSELDDVPPCYQYRWLDFKILEKLKVAVYNYGATAPLTLALLESSTERWLAPKEFSQLAQTALTGGDFVFWKSEVAETAEELTPKLVRDLTLTHGLRKRFWVSLLIIP